MTASATSTNHARTTSTPRSGRARPLSSRPSRAAFAARSEPPRCETPFYQTPNYRPLFAVYARDGALRPLTGKQLKSLALDKLLHLCPASCTSVSARVGHATAAFSAGMSAEAIKQLGKWRSDTWRTYARVTDDAA